MRMSDQSVTVYDTHMQLRMLSDGTDCRNMYSSIETLSCPLRAVFSPIDTARVLRPLEWTVPRKWLVGLKKVSIKFCCGQEIDGMKQICMS